MGLSQGISPSEDRFRFSLNVLMPLIAGAAMLSGISQSGLAVKVLMLPLVFLCLRSRSVSGLIALSILSLGGTALSYLILVAMLLYVCRFWREAAYQLNKALVVGTLAIVVAVCFWYAPRVMTGERDGLWFVSRTSFFLALIPFIYGSLIKVRWDRLSYPIVVSVLAALFVYARVFVTIFQSTEHVKSLTFILVAVSLVGMGVTMVLRRRSWSSSSLVSGLIASMIIIVLVAGFSGHVAVSLAIAITLVMLGPRVIRRYPRIVSVGMPLAVLMLTLLIPWNLDPVLASVSVAKPDNPLDVFGWSAFFQEKFFNDRAPLWSGAMRLVVDESHWFLPEEPPFIPVRASSAIGEVDYGAHHLPLELVRQFGLLFGSISAFLWLVQVAHLRRAFNVQQQSIRWLWACGLLGASIGVGFSGQWLFMLGVAVAYGGLLGTVATGGAGRAVSDRNP